MVAFRVLRWGALYECVLGVILALGAGCVVATAAPASTEQAKEVEGLVAKLGAEEYGVRVAAQSRLFAMGVLAENALQKACASREPEVCMRARAVLDRIVAADVAARSVRVARGVAWVKPLEPGSDYIRRMDLSGDVLLCEGIAELVARKAGAGDEIWRLKELSLGGGGWASDRGVVYVRSRGRLCAASLRSGEALAGFMRCHASGGPVTAGGAVVALAWNELLALDSRTGRKWWVSRIGDRAVGPLAIGCGVAVAVSSKGKLYVVELETGKMRWTRDVMSPGQVVFGVVVSRDAVVLRLDGALIGLDAKTGQLQWRRKPPAWSWCDSAKSFVDKEAIAWWDRPMVLVGDVVYLGVDEAVVGYKAATGELVQRIPLPGVIDAQGRELATGAAMGFCGKYWSSGVKGPALSPLAQAGQMIYCGSDRGVHAIDLAKGREVWRYPTPAPVHVRPVINDGALFFATTPWMAGGTFSGPATSKEAARRPTPYRLALPK